MVPALIIHFATLGVDLVHGDSLHAEVVGAR
jgi:hypothetical protein